MGIRTIGKRKRQNFQFIGNFVFFMLLDFQTSDPILERFQPYVFIDGNAQHYHYNQNNEQEHDKKQKPYQN